MVGAAPLASRPPKTKSRLQARQRGLERWPRPGGRCEPVPPAVPSPSKAKAKGLVPEVRPDPAALPRALWASVALTSGLRPSVTCPDVTQSERKSPPMRPYILTFLQRNSNSFYVNRVPVDIDNRNETLTSYETLTS